MKYIITEQQLNQLKKKPIEIPFAAFGKDWDALQTFLERKGNPKYTITDDLDLRETSIESLGNLTSVGGYLNLFGTQIKSLRNLTSVGGDSILRGSLIESLGNLTSVGGDLDLDNNTTIESLGNLTSVEGSLYLDDTPIKSLGNLTSVGGDLYLRGTPMSEQYTRTQIRNMVNISRKLYL